MLYLLVRYIIRYRLKVVRSNLRTAFPAYSESQLRQIEKDFYHHFVGLLFESLVMGFLTKRQMRKMLRFDNMEKAEEMGELSKTIICVFGHQCNWDLVASAPLWSEKIKINALYKALHNKFFDKLFVSVRQKFGTTLIPHHSAARTILKNIKEPAGMPQLYAFNTDQSPRLGQPCEWVTFFRKETAAIPVWAQMATKYNLPVIYLHIRKVGFMQFSIFIEEIAAPTVQEKLDKYYQLLEQDITSQPGQYLWSHRRWKITRDNK